VFDAGILGLDEKVGFELLADLDRSGELPQRIFGSHVANFNPGDPVATLRDLAANYASRHVSVGSMKIFVDGVPEAHTSAYLQPYADRPDTTGPLTLEPEHIRDLTVATDAAGFQCHFHALGDRAVRVALDAIEAARTRNGHTGIRHVVCHAHLVAPEDLPRFRQLDVIYQTSGQWIEVDPFHDVLTARLGERVNHQFPLRTASELGVAVTLGADFPASAYVSTFEPLVQIETAVTRRPVGTPDAVPLPPEAEALPLTTALHAMTITAAHQLGRESDLGSIRVGKQADLVVLEHDLFDIPAHRIHATKVLMTVRGGEMTHGRSAN
jgi:predicted amidohydrolase YtcJ